MAASEGTFYVDMNIFVYVILLQKGDHDPSILSVIIKLAKVLVRNKLKAVAIAYSEPSQTSKTELFAKTVHNFQQLFPKKASL